MLQQLVFDRYSYSHARPPLGKKIRSFVPLGSPSGNHVHEFLVTLPDAWVDHYLAHDYGDLDPTFSGAMTRVLPFPWRDVAGRNDLTNGQRSEEHTSELQSLMRNSYAVFCLKNKKQK